MLTGTLAYFFAVSCFISSTYKSFKITQVKTICLIQLEYKLMNRNNSLKINRLFLHYRIVDYQLPLISFKASPISMTCKCHNVIVIKPGSDQ